MMNPLEPWVRGESITAAKSNEAIEAINRHMTAFANAGVNAFQTMGGTSYSVPEQIQPLRGLFPVKVEKTGGSDGSKTAAATWTYTVRRDDWTGASGQVSADYELGTNMSPGKRRPNGKVSFPTGSATTGWGYYNSSGTFVLWDANEVFGTGGC